MEKNWRLILDQKNRGDYNMAKDEAILRMYSCQKIPTLRIYGWNAPWVSLGYNQKAEDVLNMPIGVPFVRRITGGAAILHDQEITYSISCSRNDLDLSNSVKESYRVICSFLKFFYLELGLKAEFAVEAFRKNKDLISSRESFSFDKQENFCFSAWQKLDLLVNGKKIGGNAQRYTRNAIFQQGSIPQEIDFLKIRKIIKKSDNSFKTAGCLNYFLEKITDFSFLEHRLKDAFRKTFDINLVEKGLTVQEKNICKDLFNNKYINNSWNVDKNKTELAR